MKKIIYIAFIIPFFGVSQNIDEKLNIIDSLFKHYEKNDRLFGSLSIAKGGEIIFNEQYGYENLKKKKKSNHKTKYRIGSITKTFTAVMVLQLIEENKLSFNTKLAEYYPSVPNAQEITISDLLRHQSGIFNFTNDSSYLVYHTNKKSKKELVEIIASFEPRFAPRKKSSYSNSNYVLLGFIIEDITKKSYAKNLKERIVKPLGLNDTYYGNKTKSCQNEAFSYDYMGKWIKSLETDMSVPHGAGAIVSTTNDLTAFITGLFQGELLSKAYLDSMTNIQRDFGMGLFEIPLYDRISYGHTGGIDGFSSVFGYFPDDSLAIAFSSNGTRIRNAIKEPLQIFYGMEYEWPEYKDVKIGEELLTEYVGVYESDKLPLEITIRTDNGVLIAQATGQPEFILENINDSTFKFEPARVQIIFKKNSKNGKYDLLLQQMGEFLFTRKED